MTQSDRIPLNTRRLFWQRLVSATVVLGICGALPAAETEDNKRFTQLPEIAPLVGQPAPESTAQPTEQHPGLHWIWGAADDKEYQLRKTFTGKYRSAKIRMAADNEAALTLNQKKIGTNTNWSEPSEFQIKNGQFAAGENELIVDVKNQGGPAGILLTMTLDKTDGTQEKIVTDDSWQVRLAGKDDGAWEKCRVIVKYGSEPWNNVLSGSAAQAGGKFEVPPGFQVETLFTVPKEILGSWVCVTCDDRGRLIVSDQGKEGLCRITPSPIGSREPTVVERLNVEMTGVQGMLFAFNSLYVCANGGPGSGLYRLRDTNGDDQFDELVKLKEIRGGGEHGPHALRLSPDGKSIYMIAGNHTKPPFDPLTNADPQRMGGARAEQLTAHWPADASGRAVPNWDEDLLNPRQWDAGGHAVGILAPGGWIAKTDPEGKTWDVVSNGYRNPYDMAFNADGELFAYDADMEWDIGSTWYRPTRVCHAVSGSEFGWRSGTGKWPAYFAESLPAMIDIGPGSPVGVEFGYGTKFPAKYQKALYICDWTFGTMFAVHLEPNGSSYTATKEEFVARTPLPLTDVVVGKDGALYFTSGGRGTQSELFRVTYVGKDSTAPVDLHDSRSADLRKLRHELEETHMGTPADPAKTAAKLIPHLGHSDRFIRSAARVGLERLPTALWKDAVLKSADPLTVITGSIGLARQGVPSLQLEILAALDRLALKTLPEATALGLLRAYELIFIRLGELPDPVRVRLADKFDSLFPQPAKFVNRELATLMVFLKSPQAISKLTAELAKEHQPQDEALGELLNRNKQYGGAIAASLANQPDKQQMHYAFELRNLKTGWTLDQRKTYFGWFEKAHTWSGGASYQKFLNNIDNDNFALATDADRLAIEATGARKAYVPPALPKPVGPGRDYTLDELITLSTNLKGRDFKNGQKSFASTRCVVCHRFGGDGGSTGPDLTQLAGRFTVKDLSEAIVDPSKVISDQYKATNFQTTDGQTITGRVVNETDAAFTVVIDPENATKVMTLAKKDVEAHKPSAVSLMPKDLLKTLNEDEVQDLMAYLLSRGNPNDRVFSK